VTRARAATCAVALAVTWALVAPACSASKAAAPTRTTVATTTTSTTPAPAVKVETLTGGTTTPYTYDYTVEYPQLTGLPDDGMQRSINAELMKAASEMVGDFVAVVTEEAPSSSTAAPPTSSTTAPPTSSTTTQPAAPTTRLDGKSATLLLDTRLASFRLEGDGFVSPAAHGFTRFRTLTYDLSTGRRLGLADLFRAGVDYLGWLSHESVAQLQARPEIYNPQMTPAGLTPTEEHFAHFGLTPTGLEIVFDEYQVGPYAVGTPHVTFPYVQLRPLLATPGPLDGR
jgi:hypothetical protein